MNYVISIIAPGAAEELAAICRELKLPLVLQMHARGTASKRILDLLGIESKARSVVATVADKAGTRALIAAQRRRLYIDAPGNGVVLAIPVKSVGGGKTLAYLQGESAPAGAPELDYRFELILVIANEGQTDMVMDAARAAGARGGTVLHGKGTGKDSPEKFFQVSIAQEKEILLIVSKAEEKAGIMQSILRQAGPSTPAGALVFSLPVSDVAGFSITEE